MRALLFRMAFCLTLASVFTSTASAGVRGKPANVKALASTVAQKRVAQATSDYTTVKPVPLPADTIQTETVVNEAVVEDSHSNCACAPNAVRTNTNTVIVPMMMPMMAQPSLMQVMSNPACSTCGGGMGGMSAAAAASYGQAFPNGYYRGGAEAGMYQFPYYSYRRPWYYPGQPSFHRSTDLVW